MDKKFEALIDSAYGNNYSRNQTESDILYF